MGRSGKAGSTLAQRERALGPLSLGSFLAATLACAWTLIALAHAGTSPAKLAAATLLSALPLLSNALYLAGHEGASIGMIPPALFSLIPMSALACHHEGLPQVLRVFAGGTALLLACFFVLFCIWFLRMRGAYANAPSLAGDAALMVLGATVRDGRPSPTLQARLDAAARLLREAPLRQVVVSGAGEAEAMARYLEEDGIEPARIIREEEALNTRENIALSLEALRRYGAHTTQMAVVSNDYHLWRARDHGRKLGVELVCVAARTPRSGLLQQWCREVLTILFGGN